MNDLNPGGECYSGGSGEVGECPHYFKVLTRAVGRLIAAESLQDS